MKITKKRNLIFFAPLFALGMVCAQSAWSEQYNPPVAIATATCLAGSSGYGNARFVVFPNWVIPNYRLTIWCNAGGVGQRIHFLPATTPPTVANLFAGWIGGGSATGIGWPPSSVYNNQYYAYDIDSDGDLDIFRLVEVSANRWTVFLSKML